MPSPDQPTKADHRLAAAAIERLLRPRSVAIVGASATPSALGASVLANLDRAGFKGDIYLINPNREEIGGRPCLKSPELLPEGIDVAVLAIPRVAVLDAVKKLAELAPESLVFGHGAPIMGGASEKLKQLADSI